jgi:hypothetical protein
MNLKTSRRVVLLFFLFDLVVALTAISCGGGGDGGTIYIPPQPGMTTAFTPDAPPSATESSISMQPGGTSGDLLVVLVRVTNITDFYGAAFTINYDSTTVDFRDADNTPAYLSGGSFLGANSVFATDVPTPGTVEVAASRQGAVAGVNIGSAPQTLVTLRFRAKKVTTGSQLSFGSQHQVCTSVLVAPGQCVSFPVPAPNWTGGKVTASM